MYGNVEGTTKQTQLGKLAGHQVSVSEGGEALRGKGPSLRHELGVTVGTKALLQREASFSELSTPRGKIQALQGRPPTSITGDEVSKAMKDVVNDPRLEQQKEAQKPKSYWNKMVDWFSSGRFLKIIPNAIAGPVWALIEGAKAERHGARMVAIAHDAGARTDDRGAHSLPHELALAMSGHYQLKAQKKSDQAMIGTFGMAMSPMMGPLFAPIGSAVSSLGSEVTGTVVEKSLAGLTNFGVKKGIQKLGSEPMRTEAFRTGRDEEFVAAAHLSVELDAEGSVEDIARTSRGFLRYLALPPHNAMLNSSDPAVRQQEMSRLMLKRAMGGNVGTDYRQETRTVQDQLEKMTTSGTPTPLSSSEGLSWAPVGVGSQERGTDYLRRMLVCEGMMEHGEASLGVKDS